jgi:hypothetical protein
MQVYLVTYLLKLGGTYCPVNNQQVGGYITGIIIDTDPSSRPLSSLKTRKKKPLILITINEPKSTDYTYNQPMHIPEH